MRKTACFFIPGPERVREKFYLKRGSRLHRAGTSQSAAPWGQAPDPRVWVRVFWVHVLWVQRLWVRELWVQEVLGTSLLMWNLSLFAKIRLIARHKQSGSLIGGAQ